MPLGGRFVAEWGNVEVDVEEGDITWGDGTLLDKRVELAGDTCCCQVIGVIG